MRDSKTAANRQHRQVPLAALAILLSGAACYLHTNARLLNPQARRPPSCAEGVTTFANRDQAPAPYTEIARISLWWPADMRSPTAEYKALAMRKKAAEFGANGLILGLGWDDIPPGPEGSVAIFIPADSARSAEICSGDKKG